MFDLEWNIRSWSDYLRARGNFKETDILELENHLRDEIDDLMKTGLSQDESFLIGVKRLGNVNTISQEYSKVNSENLWKHLLADPDHAYGAGGNRKDIVLVIIFSLLAGTLIEMPGWFGLRLFDPVYQLFYFKNLGLFLLPFIAIFFLIRHWSGWKVAAAVLGIFCLSALTVNLYPSYYPQNTELLTGIHLPIFLWLITGAAYMGAAWRQSGRRMDFIRFTGEAVVYGTLIFCGVVVLAVFTEMIFQAIQIDLTGFIQQYLAVYGGCATAMITVYLVEYKKSIVENFAPILAKIFSPLFLIIMIAFLIVMVLSGQSPFVDRNFLIGFDLMLVLVLGLVLYVISARNVHDNNRLFDYLNLALILVALMIDGVALSAILFRLSAFGITPNKIAALGENLTLLVNLGGLAWLYLRYFAKKIDFSRLEKWQTAYLYVYVIWMAVVAFAFPVIFHFS
ncbi:permease prefix domain 1-containing protein [Sporolactobacillus sp. CQH2019]|uniref:permease prefix domain 1-containing protein n=1 Tax=Sporolactobacillus sp. CQH2019 TaxID=3023512 RepID=UPI00236899E7|nr:permease prefix domain 1-containing protein [Sporolactobacillus sp. CQH2019]MDD9149083.1 permease prefix domain 1-containing protein [Sporolactobacillus sp. CQH2019]